MHQPGIRPPVRRLGVETPEIQQCRPSRRPDPRLPHPINPPQAQPVPAVGDESPLGAPPFFRSGVKMLVCANSKIFTPISGGGTSPRPFPGPATHVATPTTR